MQTNNNFNLIDNLEIRAQEIGKIDRVLGKGLYQPFNCANSGSRKLMHSTHLEHTVIVKDRCVPYIMTGYEMQFGDYNSCVIKTGSHMEVVDIIHKFSFNPKLVYYVILKDFKNKTFKVVERRNSEYTTENYGYDYDNSIMDMLESGYILPENQYIRKSTAYDEYGNRMDGIQLNCVYVNTEKNMEDSVIISESTSKRCATKKYGTTTVMYNDNDIPLFIYGGEKSFPDVGEETQGGMLCAIRRSKREEAEYTQTREMLQKIMMSDEIITLNGRVYDINIYCNNPDILKESMYNRQLYRYYLENVRFKKEIVDLVNRLKAQYPDFRIDYQLDKIYYEAVQYLAGAKYTKDRNKEFSNTVIEFFVEQECPLEIGDKISNRYGGKGVVSHIFPDCLMPYNPETGEYADIIFNSNTCVGRKNPGQIFEIHLNSASSQIVHQMYKQKLGSNECAEWIYEFLSIVCPQEAEAFKNELMNYNASDFARQEELDMFIQSVIDEGHIRLSTEPISESITIDTLDKLYKAFPFIHDPYLIVPVKNSRGKYRLIQSRLPMPFGSIYIYRLKQHSEEKFSATSLSSTNIKSLNTKSKANKEYRTPHSKTPIQFGNMESGDMGNIGMEYVITVIMIHSVSPKARRMMEAALTGDPYDININLQEDCANRNVEIVNAYLKANGLRLVFKKILKQTTSALSYVYNNNDFYKSVYQREALIRNHNNILTQEYIDQFEEERQHRNQVLEKNPVMQMPIRLLTDEELEKFKLTGEID